MTVTADGIRTWGEMTTPKADALLSDRVSAFTRELAGRAKKLDDLTAGGEQDAAVLYAALQELRVQHEELLVAEEELTAQRDEIQAAQARTELERTRYRQLFDDAPIAFVVTNERGIIAEANDAAAGMFDIDLRFIRGKPITVFVDSFDIADVRTLVDAVVTSGKEVRDVRLRRRNGERFWASLACVSGEQGRRLLWNISDLGAAREEQAERTIDARRVAELERELRDKEDLLARERRLRHRMEHAERAKDRFIAVLSHDLRAPLNAVLGWADLLRREILSKESRERALATIDRNARMQLALVEELLDLSRITADRIRLELAPLDLRGVVERLVAGLEPAAAQAKLRLELTAGSESVTVFADQKRLEQILSNLLANAMKFTPSGGKITVSVAERDRNAEVAIQDTGVGIARDELPKVFECFHQDARDVTARSGLGLGLYIVRHLAELHGGSVEARSDGEGRGATFVLRLPAHDRQSADERPSERRVDSGPGLDGVRVLVVDDEPDAREVLSMILTHEGAHVAGAGDAATALAALDTFRPDIVLSDIGLAQESGNMLLQRLRARAPDLAAIAVTGYVATEDAEKSLAAGFDLQVAKPIEASAIVSAVRTVLDRRTSSRSRSRPVRVDET